MQFILRVYESYALLLKLKILLKILLLIISSQKAWESFNVPISSLNNSDPFKYTLLGYWSICTSVYRIMSTLPNLNKHATPLHTIRDITSSDRAMRPLFTKYLFPLLYSGSLSFNTEILSKSFCQTLNCSYAEFS